jgi:hypothetical protein
MSQMPSCKTLTAPFAKLAPPSFSHIFQVVLLPNKISSLLISLLQKLPVKDQLWEAHTRAKLAVEAISTVRVSHDILFNSFS